MCNPFFNEKLIDDKYFGKNAYIVEPSEKAIREEIQVRGPVEATIIMYEDFLLYKEGIYRHLMGKGLIGHAVKIIGWGTENGVPYWLCANSWGRKWGEVGFFRILRGQNECSIEEAVFAGERFQ